MIVSYGVTLGSSLVYNASKTSLSAVQAETIFLLLGNPLPWFVQPAPVVPRYLLQLRMLDAFLVCLSWKCESRDLHDCTVGVIWFYLSSLCIWLALLQLGALPRSVGASQGFLCLAHWQVPETSDLGMVSGFL